MVCSYLYALAGYEVDFIKILVKFMLSDTAWFTAAIDEEWNSSRPTRQHRAPEDSDEHVMG